MGDTHVRKSLIPEESRVGSTGKPSGESKANANAADSSGKGKVRVIAITSVFVLLLGFVAYRYWSGSEPKYIPPEAEAPAAEPTKPDQPRNTAPTPAEQPPERHDVIQG